MSDVIDLLRGYSAPVQRAACDVQTSCLVEAMACEDAFFETQRDANVLALLDRRAERIDLLEAEMAKRHAAARALYDQYHARRVLEGRDFAPVFGVEVPDGD